MTEPDSIWLIEVTPKPERSEVMFTIVFRSGNRRTYWKGWWRAHLHALRLIFSGHRLVTIDDRGRLK